MELGIRVNSKGKRMRISRIFAAVTTLAIPAIALAGPGSQPLPEPETLGLLAIGAAALIVAKWRAKK